MQEMYMVTESAPATSGLLGGGFSRLKDAGAARRGATDIRVRATPILDSYSKEADTLPKLRRERSGGVGVTVLSVACLLHPVRPLVDIAFCDLESSLKPAGKDWLLVQGNNAVSGIFGKILFYTFHEALLNKAPSSARYASEDL